MGVSNSSRSALRAFVDVLGYPVGDQPVGGLGDELGDEQLPLRGGDGDGQQFAGQVGVAAHLGLGAGDGLAGFADAVAPVGFVDEGEGGAGALAFEFGGAEGVGADDPDGGGAQRARGGAVVPVGDGQVRQRGAVVAGQGDGLIEQGQAPDGTAAVQDARGFPFDVRLGEDRLDDLAHLAVVDDGVAVAVDRQNGSGVGAGDRLPARDGLQVRGAVAVDAGDGVDLGGDRVPVQSGERCGPHPKSRDSPAR